LYSGVDKVTTFFCIMMVVV